MCKLAEKLTKQKYNRIAFQGRNDKKDVIRSCEPLIAYSHSIVTNGHCLKVEILIAHPLHLRHADKPGVIIVYLNTN